MAVCMGFVSKYVGGRTGEQQRGVSIINNISYLMAGGEKDEEKDSFYDGSLIAGGTSKINSSIPFPHRIQAKSLALVSHSTWYCLCVLFTYLVILR